MRIICRASFSIVMLVVVGSLSFARADVIFSAVGRWDAATLATPLSAPGGYFSFSFLVKEPLGAVLNAYAGSAAAGFYDSNGSISQFNQFSVLDFLPPGPSVFPGVVPGGGGIGAVSLFPSFPGSESLSVLVKDFWPIDQNGVLIAPRLQSAQFILYSNDVFPSNFPEYGHGFGFVSLIRAPNVTTGVPEPATWAMLLAGFAGLGFTARRRRAVAS